jgi:excisionase family DNA binding protein
MSQSVVDRSPHGQIASAVYTAQHIGVLLGVCTRTVWRLSDEGRIPGRFKLGGVVRWNKAAVDQWIKAGCPRK